jgi:hypothetical protein
MLNFTDTMNGDIYQLVKRLYAEGLLILFDHFVLVSEMLTLEAEKKARDRSIVSAPSRKGAHDDISDSYCRAVSSCYNDTSERACNMATGAGGRTRAGAGMETQASFILNRLRNHGQHPRGLYKTRRAGIR